MSDLYIGLMSGTSADGIDVALVDFSTTTPSLVASHYTAYQPALRNKILALCKPGENEIQRLGELDIILGKEFAHAIKQLLQKSAMPAQSVQAIGSHGQTVRHHPHAPHRFTLQIGDPNTIAAETGITTVADFRRKDIAHGGQGAPLVPAFHQYVFTSEQTDRAIVNIGGIANVTLLPCNHPGPILGFDLGPGNVLLDAWIHLHQQATHDKNGAWGAQGKVNQALLTQLLAHDFFRLAPPKSTGREHFHLDWLQQTLLALPNALAAVDVQATLVELTARSIIEPIREHLAGGEILICGGGVHNAGLMARLSELAKPDFSVASTAAANIDPDWVEAIAFAWLARQTLNHKPGNLPSVTGAKTAAMLGGVYFADDRD